MKGIHGNQRRITKNKGIQEKLNLRNVIAVVLALFMLMFLFSAKGRRAVRNALSGTVRQKIYSKLCESVIDAYFPLAAWGNGSSFFGLVDSQVEDVMPFYGYYLENSGEKYAVRAQAGEGGKVGEDEERIREEKPDEETTGEEKLSIEKIMEGEVSGEKELSGEEKLEKLMEKENQEKTEILFQDDLGYITEDQTEENEGGISDGFVPRTTKTEIDLEELSDYNVLVKKFYTIDENTMSDSGELNVSDFLERDLTIDKNTDGPQILIYHTHSQEAYADSIPGDESTSVMGMGDKLTRLLTEVYGYQVLHHRGKYDVVSRDYAYSEALPEIEKILEEYPSIQVVIDLHRDAVPEHTRLAMDVDGRPTARFMFFNGLSRTKQTGDIAYLYNENLQDNLAFSFQMQLMSESYYPGLARRIYLKGYRYNMHFKPRNMLIELGAQNNTVEEAQNAIDIIAFLLDKVLSGEN